MCPLTATGESEFWLFTPALFSVVRAYSKCRMEGNIAASFTVKAVWDLWVMMSREREGGETEECLKLLCDYCNRRSAFSA